MCFAISTRLPDLQVSPSKLPICSPCRPLTADGNPRKRRVKCDETKPLCSRCTRSGLASAGYCHRRDRCDDGLGGSDDAARMPPSAATMDASIVPSPMSRQVTVVGWSGSDPALAGLGVALLRSSCFPHPAVSGQCRQRFLLQLAASFPQMNSAATAAGAFYRLRFGARNGTTAGLTGSLRLVAYTHYVAALRYVRTNLASASYQRTPVVSICFMLASIEILAKRPLAALAHLRGAFKVYRGTQDVTEYFTSRQSVLSGRSSSRSGDDHELEGLFQVLNLQNMLYAMSYEPGWAGNTLQLTTEMFSNLSSRRTSLLAIMEQCLQWSARNFRLRWFPSRQSPELLIEQGRHCAALTMWLDRFNSVIMPRQGSTQYRGQETLEDLELALRLRMICLSTLIHISHLFDPSQASYDSQELRFRQIVADGQQILRVRLEIMNDSPCSEEALSPPLMFSVELGIIEPLFHTASACRFSALRREAIACLLNAGQEGPWIGSREAASALRIVQHEEAWPHAPPPWSGLELEWKLDQARQGSSRSQKKQPTYASQGMTEVACLISCITRPEDLSEGSDSATVSFIRCHSIREMLALLEGYTGAVEDIFSPTFYCSTWEETLW